MEKISNFENLKVEENTKYIEEKKIGGVALFNGLILRSNKRESVIKYSNNKISIDIAKIEKNNKKDIINNIPVLRGIINIINVFISCIPYLVSSAKSTLNKYVQDKNVEDEIEINNFEIVTGLVIAVTIILLFFIFLPNVLSTFVIYRYKNIFECIIQVISFSIYLFLINNISILKSVFEYHGAEHKVVNAYENLKIDDITVENVKKESRFHIRCGGNFIVYLLISFLICTLVIPSTNIYIKTVIQILLIPILIGLSYEILFIISKFKGIFSYIAYPATLIQFITTREPDDEKIQLAIYGLFGCINEKNDNKLKQYLNRYINNNLKNNEYEMNDIYRIVAKVKNVTKEEIILNCEKIVVSYQEQIILDRLLNKLYKENIPLQYILGKQNFYNEVYEVNENVLIPRADTEILVEKAIEYIEKENLEKLIDMCTGSGCVGISIAKNSNIKFGFLVDVSKEALEVARKNIILNEVGNKVCILKSNLFDEFEGIQENKYDIIVSNPPYIKTSVIKTLDKNVQNEPILALDGGKDGLQVYRKIFEQSKKVLKTNGYLMLEIGYDQLEQITKIINKDENYELIESVKDLGGNDRVIVCRFLQK